MNYFNYSRDFTRLGDAGRRCLGYSDRMTRQQEHRTRLILSRLLTILLLPVVFVLAVVADILGVEIAGS